MKNYLNFEADIKRIETELEELKDPYKEGLTEVDTNKISGLQSELDEKLKEVYSNLNAWETVLVARHEDRPKSKFFIDNLFDDFITLSGDRYYGEDKSVIAGFARLNNDSVLVIGQEKGDNLESRIERNFGMMRPEGYRKTIRLMKLAEKYKIPIISFIDTPGAYPGIGAEQRGQAESIASSIECCMSLEVPIISVIIGEGGSGGAIALASANKVLMFENAIFSVISPEGCASILWRDPSKSLEAAQAMKLTAQELFKMKIVDEIIQEPIGGAHRDKEFLISSTRDVLVKYLDEFKNYSKEDIYQQRREKFLNIGKQKSFSVFSKESINLFEKTSIYSLFKDKIIPYKKKLLVFFILIVSLISMFYLL